jgi:hypothetical protein
MNISFGPNFPTMAIGLNDQILYALKTLILFFIFSRIVAKPCP